MATIDDTYIKSRQDTERRELDEWANAMTAQTQPPAPGQASTPEPQMSLIMTPQGRAQPPPGAPSFPVDPLKAATSLLPGLEMVGRALEWMRVKQPSPEFHAAFEEQWRRGPFKDKPMPDPGIIGMMQSAAETGPHGPIPTTAAGRMVRGTARAAALPTPQAMPIENLRLDPQRFQYKVLQGEGGATGSLGGVERFDPNLAGVIAVWTDPANGQTFVVNGHNRYALAKRAGQDTINVLPIQADTAEEARTLGAMMNIAEGRGSAIDAAKFFRDTGLSADDLRAQGIPLREKIAADGLALANLADSLFQEVVQGTLPLERAIIIGSRLADPDQQVKLMQLIRQRGERTMTHAQVRELADFVQQAPTQQRTQETLFGMEESTVNLALDKARIAANIRERLATDKTLFAKVSKESAAARLTESGAGAIHVEEAQRLAQESGTLLDIFDRLKHATGPISDILNEASQELQAGGNLRDITNRTYQRLTDALPEALRRAESEGLRADPGLSTGATTSTGDTIIARAERQRGATSEAGLPIREPAPGVEPSSLPPPTEAPPLELTPPPEAPTPTRPTVSPHLNLRYVNAPEARKAIMREIDLELEASGAGAAQRGQISHAETIAAAKGKVRTDALLGLQPNQVLADIPLNEQVVGARDLANAGASTVRRLRQRIINAGPGGDAEAEGLLDTATDVLREILLHEEGLSAAVARGLEAHKINSSAARANFVAREMTAALETIDASKTPFEKALILQAAEEIGGEKAIKAMAKNHRHGWMAALIEARQAGLMGIAGLGRNLTSNLFTAVWGMLESEMTAIWGNILRTPNRAYMGEGFVQAYGMWRANKNGLHMVGKALKEGEAQFLPEFTKQDLPDKRAISAESLDLTGLPGRMADVAGEIIRWKFRALMAGDDYFKHAHVEATKYGLAYRTYHRLKAAGSTESYAQSVHDDIIANPPEWVRKAGEEEASYKTFNDALVSNVAKKFMDARATPGPEGWILQTLVPYAKNPLNMLGYGAERTPILNFLSKHWWQEMGEKGVRRDAALARLSLGTMALGTMVMYGLMGGITGRGPKDRNLRRTMEDNGWLPYSFVLPSGRHVSFQGLMEPLSTFLGQAGDAADLMKYGADTPSVLQVLTAITTSSMEYISEQPMLTGLSDTIDLLDADSDTHATDVLSKQLSTFLPPAFQGELRIAANILDPMRPEVRGPHGGRGLSGVTGELDDLIEDTFAKVPGAKGWLYPQRDLFGRPRAQFQGIWRVLSQALPFRLSPAERHPVFEEMIKQGVSIAPTPQTFGQGKQPRSALDPSELEYAPIQLSNAEWDRFQVLVGEVKADTDPSTGNDATLETYLTSLIKTPAYRVLSRGPGGGRDQEITRTFARYRAAAKTQLLEEFPMLAELIERKKRLKAFQSMDIEEQERLRPELERQEGRPIRLGIER